MRTLVLLCLSLPLAGQILAPIVAGGDAAYYVDSVAGNDVTGDGSIAAPFRTIGKLTTVDATAPRSTWNLKKDSIWYEQLSVPRSNMTVQAYGTGTNDPILDGSDDVVALGCTKTGGYTNIYQIPITVSSYGGNGIWVNVFENDVQMVRKGSLALMDATAGTYGVAGFSASQDPSGSTTLYIHATGDGNPCENGKAYRYTNRSFAVAMLSHPGGGANTTGVTLSHIWGRRGSNYSQIELSPYSKCLNCTSTQANDHNLFMSAYSSVVGGLYQSGYWGNDNGQTKALIVCYISTGTGVETYSISGATITGDGAGDKNTGILGHTTSGTIASVSVSGVTISNTQQGVSLANTLSVSITGSNLSTPAGATSGSNTVFVGPELTTLTITNTTLTGRTDIPWRTVESDAGTPAVTITGSTIVGRTGVWTAGGSIVFNNNTCGNGSGSSGCIYINSGTLSSFSATGNTFNWPQFSYYYLFANNPTAVSSDNNIFVSPGTSRRYKYDGADKTLAQWQALGFDTHSTSQ